MLLEVMVRDLGVLATLSLVVGDGMTALTGETGAGKTMLVTALQLLAGGRADPSVVRPGAKEARVDGRFLGADGEEVVLSRAVPADGRSRAYIDGRPVPIAVLAELAEELVDLHGQHAHQTLLAPATQRAALDDWGGIDRRPLEAARAALLRITSEQASLGGDERARARETDLVRFQVDELDGAAIEDAEEDDRLRELEVLLGDASAARVAGAAAQEALAGEGGATDVLAAAIAALSGRPAFAPTLVRLQSLAVELADVAGDVRSIAEDIDDDPARLVEVGRRRAVLADLRRKYGDTLGEVLAYRHEAQVRLHELERHDARAAALAAERTEAEGALVAAEAQVAAARRAAAPSLAASVEGYLRALAMPRAVITVAVEGVGPADEVRFLLAANPGEPAMPLAKVASGGELARTMLALRLALLGGTTGSGGKAGSAGKSRRTLVFDEVDAGIGGEAALTVGRSLAQLGETAQVLVVTHLPQVAAFADRQVAVRKDEIEGRTVATATEVVGDARVVELSRMLSGQPESATARSHAVELLASATGGRKRTQER